MKRGPSARMHSVQVRPIRSSLLCYCHQRPSIHARCHSYPFDQTHVPLPSTHLTPIVLPSIPRTRVEPDHVLDRGVIGASSSTRGTWVDEKRARKRLEKGRWWTGRPRRRLQRRGGQGGRAEMAWRLLSSRPALPEDVGILYSGSSTVHWQHVLATVRILCAPTPTSLPGY